MPAAMKRSRVRLLTLLALVSASGIVAACGVTTWNSSLHEPGAATPPPASNRWLKVHTVDGGLYVLELWEIPDETDPLRGAGVRFDVDREVVEQASFTIERDSIALLETNDKDVVSRFALGGLTVYTTLAGAVTFACLADPKSCFGSCPTFYASVDADRPLAEGFSSSFARVLEERDVDHLGLRSSPGPFSLVMRNEAQETHAVRHVRLLAVPVAAHEEVLLTSDGRFRQLLGQGAPVSCTSEDGSCLDEVTRRDDTEYSPLTDEDDLARREEVVVDFGGVSGTVGLVLSARHSLVSTYVFYQALAYGGDEVGSVLADLERGSPGVQDRVLGLPRELGGIQILASIGDAPFAPIGTFAEAGPIASDRQLFEIGTSRGSRVRVMLQMARGSWRIDEASLAHLGSAVEPIELSPERVEALNGSPEGGLDRLLEDEAYLVTTQGDAHRIWFNAPAGSDYQLFLDTQGYYYEWMREAWLEEQSALAAASVLYDPRRALRDMAPRFKAVEGEMEDLFWSSRFRR